MYNTFTEYFNAHVKSADYPYSSVSREKCKYALQILGEDIEK